MHKSWQGAPRSVRAGDLENGWTDYEIIRTGTHESFLGEGAEKSSLRRIVISMIPG